MGSQRDPGEQQRRPHFTERYLYSQSVLVIIMCDSSETQTNGGQEIPETSEAPEAVEPVGVEEAEKKEEVAEPEPVDVEGAEKKEEVAEPEPVGVEGAEKKEEVAEPDPVNVEEAEKKEEVAEPEPEAVAEAEAQNTEDNQATEPSGNSDTTEEKKEEASSEPEKTTTCLTNESNSTEKDIEDANKKTAKTVAGILTRVKEDTEKIDTLCLLLSKFVEENGVLKNEVGIMLEQIKKHNAAKETLKAMNAAYKKQVDLVKEECELRLKEEMTKRQDNMGSYSATMEELSGLLETQSGQNSKLLTDNTNLGEQMSKLIGETQKREDQFVRIQTEYGLQIKLFEAQLKKAQLEKAEVKCEMTQERIDLAKELETERGRNSNLERTVTNLREQLDIYEKQSSELSQGVGNNAKQFQHFKTQIDKLTSTMTTLEKETSQWREKSELSAKQVQKMNQVSMEKDKEMAGIKKKLEGMAKLNQALSSERSELLSKVKALDEGVNGV